MRCTKIFAALLLINVGVCAAMESTQNNPLEKDATTRLAQANPEAAADTSSPPAKKLRLESEAKTPVAAPIAAPHKTPKRKPQASAQPTPGQRSAQRRAEKLSRDALVAVVGQAFVDELDLPWKLIQDPAVPVEDHRLRHSLFRLSQSLQHLKSQWRRQNRSQSDLSTLESIWTEALVIRENATEVHRERVEFVAKTYFQSNMFAGCHLDIHDKFDGVQLGKRVLATFKGDTLPVAYYVKTHSQGWITSKSTAAKDVDGRELFVYKLLEYLGMGCQTHFLHRSLQDVYLATLDANIKVQPPEGERPHPTDTKDFILFSRVTDDRHDKQSRTTLGKALWGRLHESVLEHRHSKGGWGIDVEKEIQSTQDTKAINFIHEAAVMNILSRILHLHDFLNNPDNFGFIYLAEDTLRCRGIDFRLDFDQENFRVDEKDMTSFLKGNGQLRINNAHPALSYALCKRPANHRVREAFDILSQGRLQNFENCVKRATTCVEQYFNQDIFEEKRDDLLLTLHEYCDSIIANARFFKQQFADHLASQTAES
ncbi:MAG: hypothetical protein ACPG7U_04400 [Holosporaceae bacterium]